MARQIGKNRRAELLKSVWLFSLCTARELADVAGVAEEVSAEPGDVLVRQGDVGAEFYVVVAGIASVDVDGRDVGEVGPGEFFGEMALLDRGPRSGTVVARERMALLCIDWRDMSALFRSSPTIAEKMLRVVGQRLRDAHERVRAVADAGEAP